MPEFAANFSDLGFLPVGEDALARLLVQAEGERVHHRGEAQRFQDRGMGAGILTIAGGGNV